MVCFSYSGMLKGQKTNLVAETDYHNKEERVKVNKLMNFILMSFSSMPSGCA